MNEPQAHVWGLQHAKKRTGRGEIEGWKEESALAAPALGVEIAKRLAGSVRIVPDASSQMV